MEGFYVPGSYSSSYVSNKADEQGARYYENQSIEIGKQTQAALTQLSSNYEQTINDAYASYLASQQSIGNSAMGQGYKEAYLEMAKNQFQNNIISSNHPLEQAPLQIQQQGQHAQAALQQQFATDTANLDRFVTSFGAYKDYLAKLTPNPNNQNAVISEGQSYLSEDQKKMTVDDLYNFLMEAQPEGYVDENENRGLTFTEWLNSQYGPGSKGSQADQDWFNWAMFQGGYDDFKNALAKKANQTEANQYQAIKEEEARQEAERQRQLEEARLAEERRQQELRDRVASSSYNGQITSTSNWKKIRTNGSGYEGSGNDANYSIQTDSGTYQIKRKVAFDSDLSYDLGSALNAEKKLDSGEWHVGDIIKYKGKYYIITDKRSKGARLAKHGHVEYYEIDYKI